VKNLINKLKENKYRVFKIVDREQIEIIDSDSFESSQDGYRFNSITNKPIDDWNKMVGKNFYVIGSETNLGDPIIADAGTQGFPIYFMMHDDWESLEKVANSFDEFILNLKTIDKMINDERQNRSEIRKLVRKLDKENNTDGFYELMCYDVLQKDGFYYKNFKAYKTQERK